MTNRQTPPGLTSILNVVVVNPLGPHQLARCLGSVHSLKTRSRGASKMRVAVMSRSPTIGDASLMRMILPFAVGLVGFLLLLLALKLFEVFVESIETLFPEPAVMLDPVGDILERA